MADETARFKPNPHYNISTKLGELVKDWVTENTAILLIAPESREYAKWNTIASFAKGLLCFLNNREIKIEHRVVRREGEDGKILYDNFLRMRRRDSVFM